MRLSNLWERDRKFWERWEHEHRWDDLSKYNAEVARGIVHTDEWKARMTERQIAFNAEQRDLHPNDIVIGGPE